MKGPDINILFSNSWKDESDNNSVKIKTVYLCPVKDISQSNYFLISK